MSINRKNPLHFDLRYGSQRHQLALAPFSGLDLNENPLTANKGSCSDMLNMVVDDNAFLTLRPRLVDDPEYLKAKQSVEEDLTGDYVIFQQVLGQRYIKDGYLFLVGEIAKQEIAVLTITDSLTLPNNSGVGFNITVKIGGFSYNVALNDNYTYPKPLLTSIIWAQIGGYPDLPFSMAMTSKTSTITFTFIEKDGQLPEYNVSPTVPLGIEIPHTFSILQYGVSGTNKALVFNHKGIKHWILYYYFNDLKYLDSFDDFLIYPEKDYYRFIQKSDGKNFILKLKDDQWEFKELEPYIPMYKGAIESIETLESAPINEDLNILTNKYRISVRYKTSTSINLKYFEQGAIDKKGNILNVNKYDFNTDSVIVHKDDDGYIYFLNSEYQEASTITGSDPYLFHFYYYSFSLKISEPHFTIKVYSGGSHADGITKEGLKDFYDTPFVDGNGKKIPQLYYDVDSHSLLRHKRIVVDGLSTYEIYHYSIGDNELISKDFYVYKHGNQWEGTQEVVYYIDGEIGIYVSVFKMEASSPRPGQPALLIPINKGDAFVVYNANAQTLYSLFGLLKEEEDVNILVQNKLFVVSYHLVIMRYIRVLSYISVGGKQRLFASGNLRAFIDQKLNNDETYLEPIDPTLQPEDVRGFILYYDVNGSIEKDELFNLSEKLPKLDIDLTLSSYTITTAGNYVALHKERNLLLYLVDVEYPDQSVSFNLLPLFNAPDIVTIRSFYPTTWGYVYGYIDVIKDDDLNPALLVINKERSIRYAFVQYDYYPIKELTVATPTHYFTVGGLNIIDLSSSHIYKVGLKDTIIDYTYDLTNENNPLKIKQEVLDIFKERQEAFKFTSGVSGRTLITDALLYYNDKYTFVTDPELKDYNYIPAIHCQKSLNPIRFASSYLQELGIIYQQNSVTYLGWDENKNRNITFLAHPYVLQYDHLEQRAIDYLPNGHLVTFAGLTIYLNKSGVYALNFEPETPQDTERRATLISGAINSKLLKEDLSTAILANFTPYILILFPKNGYTSVYALKIMVGQWYYWELPFKVKQVLDDNVSLRLINGDRFVRLNEDVELVDVFDDNRVVLGSVEKYLDFGTKPIKWYWKSQPIHLGTITARKQITQTHFVFLNPNASFDFDRDTFDLTHSQITSQRFGVRFYAFQEHVTERPSIDYEAELQIINNIQRRTYINRFKYCQLLCYNIDDDGATSDKVRLGDIIFTYKVLSGGK